MSVSLLSFGIAIPVQAGIPEELAAFKTAASELKTCMVSITNEATAKAKVGTLEAAITKLNQANTTLDASLTALDRSSSANARLYQETQTEKGTVGQSLVAEKVRLLSERPICAVVCPKLSALHK
jgi:hypothetical protein